MIGFLVKDIGTLRINNILQNLTVGKLDDITSPNTALRYATIILDEKIVDSRKKSRRIEFEMDDEEPRTEEEMLWEELGWLEEEGGKHGDKELIKVNPKLFREMKYRVKVVPDILTQPSTSVNRALSLELYDRAIGNPLSDQEAVTRDFLFESYRPGESDKYIKKQAPQEQMQGQAGGKATAPDKFMEKLVEKDRTQQDRQLAPQQMGQD